MRMTKAFTLIAMSTCMLIEGACVLSETLPSEDAGFFLCEKDSDCVEGYRCQPEVKSCISVFSISCDDGYDENCVNEIGSLMWKKCAQGMVYDSAGDACAGDAGQFQYCDGDDNSCNGGTGDGILDGGGNSEAWDTCNNMAYAGFNDWRVPTVEELANLVVCNDGPLNYPSRDGCGAGNYTSPTIDTSLFPDFPDTGFWSSASYVGNSYYAWNVNFFLYGHTNAYNKSGTRSVLCVR